jgi:hypothetical protein
VYQLNAFIALKETRTGEDERADMQISKECFRFSKITRRYLILIRCDDRRPNDTFLEFAAKWGRRNATQPVLGARQARHISSSLDESRFFEEKWPTSSDTRPRSPNEAVDVIVLPIKGPDIFPFYKALPASC